MVNLTVEALESVHGRGAVGLHARLETLVDKDWVLAAESRTNESGRIEAWAGGGERQGLYRIVFDVDRYFAGLGMTPIFPDVVTMFRVSGERTGYQVSVNFSLHHYSAAFTVT
ncbi:hydroxyisourate hydrolase [Streptomyces anulatus]|uniref:hydroxyisourate hydrolase n=1 Tax=Streptomyces anulatus TaxID=1892 RepID=UPI003701F25C